MVEVIEPEQTSRATGGRPITACWRFDEEGILIVLNPQWRDYYHYNYVTKYGCKVTCNLCSRVVVQSKLNRHQQTEICKRKRAHIKI